MSAAAMPVSNSRPDQGSRPGSVSGSVSGSAEREQGRLSARAAAEHALFAVFPLIFAAWLLHGELAHGNSGIDFRDAYWVAGHRLLHGLGPYAYTPPQAAGGEAFVYPALAALLFTPFALLPVSVAGVLFVIACMAATWLTLRVLDVSDWRLYGLAIVWPPVIAGWQTANLTLPLVLMLALVWRFRDRPVVVGAIAAAMISLKPFTWPLAVWLLSTRRFRAVAWLAAVALVLNAVAWGAIGFDQVSRYLRLSGEVTHALDHTGYGALSLLARLGVTGTAASALQVGAAAAVAALCAWTGWRRRQATSLALAVATMLVGSPLVWNHYPALFLVPLAIMRPRLSAAWLVPLLLLVCPSDGVADWQAFLLWTVFLGLTLRLALGGPTVVFLRQRRTAVLGS